MTSIAGPKNSNSSMNGKAIQPTTPPRRLNISDRFDHRLSARPYCQRMRWLRNALARHLVIEEQLLFPAYLAAGGRAGWVRGLCNEHALLRRDLERLHDAGARRRFLLLLDGHDEKEEQIVYPDIIARAVAGDDALTRAVLHLALPAASGALATATHGNSTGPAASTP